MERISILTHRILTMANQVPDCAMEDVQAALPDYTWNQIFLEVDRMSRNGQLRLSLKGAGATKYVPPKVEAGKLSILLLTNNRLGPSDSSTPNQAPFILSTFSHRVFDLKDKEDPRKTGRR